MGSTFLQIPGMMSSLTKTEGICHSTNTSFFGEGRHHKLKKTRGYLESEGSRTRKNGGTSHAQGFQKDLSPAPGSRGAARAGGRRSAGRCSPSSGRSAAARRREPGGRGGGGGGGGAAAGVESVFVLARIENKNTSKGRAEGAKPEFPWGKKGVEEKLGL